MNTPNNTHDLIPTNMSLRFFIGAWRQCVFGGAKYLIRHPIAGPKILWNRLRFPLFKKPLKEPLRTPEGFVLRSMLELHLYCNMFVEQPLNHPKISKALRERVNPFVLDVGSCLGMFAQWVCSQNSTAIVHCFEPMEPMVRRSRELIDCQSKFTRCIKVNHAAVTAYTGLATLHVGTASSLKKPIGESSAMEVQCTSIDRYLQEYICPEVFILKIDTDGSNPDVITGAQSALTITRFLIVEKEAGLKIPDYFKLIGESVEDLFYENSNLGTSADDYLMRR